MFKVTRWSDGNEDLKFSTFDGTVAVKDGSLDDVREYVRQYSVDNPHIEVIAEDGNGERVAYFRGGADFDLDGAAFVEQPALEPVLMEE